MLQLEVKAGTAFGGHRGITRWRHQSSVPYPYIWGGAAMELFRAEKIAGLAGTLECRPQLIPRSAGAVVWERFRRRHLRAADPWDETVFRSRRNHPETKGWVSSSPASRGWPKCNFSSNWFGTSHAAITSPQWVSGTSSNDGGNCRYSHAN